MLRFRPNSSGAVSCCNMPKEQSDADPVAQRSILLDAREEFLRAALLRPGDLETARHITAITRRLRELEVVIEKQRVEEEKRHEELAKIIERLQKVTARQQRLSQQSQQILRRYPPPPQSQRSPASLPSSNQAGIEPLGGTRLRASSRPCVRRPSASVTASPPSGTRSESFSRALTAISEGRPRRNWIRWQICSQRPWSLNNRRWPT